MRPLSVRRPFLAVAVLGAALAAAPAAEAIVPCAKTATPEPLVSGRGWVEAVAFDPAGRLYFSDLAAQSLLVLDAPDATPRVVATGIVGPGGIAFDGAGHVFVGTGNQPGNGQDPKRGGAGIVRIDLATGAKTRVAKGLAMVNGLVRTAKGVFYASDNFAPVLDRVRASGRVDRAWSTFAPTNGLALSPDGRYLYANRGGTPARTVRMDLRKPSRITTVAKGLRADGGGLDGLALAPDGRLFGAAFGPGQVWATNGTGGYCRLAAGIPTTTTVIAGVAGSGFDPASLYVGSAKGIVVRLPAVL